MRASVCVCVCVCVCVKKGERHGRLIFQRGVRPEFPVVSLYVVRHRSFVIHTGVTNDAFKSKRSRRRRRRRKEEDDEEERKFSSV